MEWGNNLLSPAERIANHFRRTVYASRKIVVGKWDDILGTAIFDGEWLPITPATDITSLMEKLKIDD